MKVLIIGGMGIIGSAITEASCNKGYEVYILSRRPVTTCFQKMGAKGIQGDWKNEEFVIKLLSDKFDVIVDTLIFSPEELMRDLRLVDNNCTQFIYISTDAVYNHPANGTNEETIIDLSKLEWDYGHKKREAEMELCIHGKEHSFFWTVVRPTMTYGDRRVPVGFGSRKNEWSLIERIKDGKPILNFDTGCLHAMCHATTFGNAAVDLFLNENAYGEFFHISDDHSVRYEDVYQIIGKLFGRSPVIITVSTDFLKTLSPAKYTEMVFDKNPEFTLDNRKIKAISPNVDYAINLEKAIESEVNFLRENYSSLPEDKDYNILTDIILLSYKEMQLSEVQFKQVEQYLSTLSPTYISSLKKHRVKCQVKKVIRPIYRLLR